MQKMRPTHLRHSWLFVGAASDLQIKEANLSEADVCIQEFEGFWDRSLRQRTKHRRRLGGEASLEAYEMSKPKSMWQRTFYRLQRAAQDAEQRADDDFIIAA